MIAALVPLGGISVYTSVFGQTTGLVNPERWHMYQSVQQLVAATHRKEEGYLARYCPHQTRWFDTDASRAPNAGRTP